MTLVDVLHRWRRSSSLPTPHPVPHQVDRVGPVEVFAMIDSDVQPERRDAAASAAELFMIKCRPCQLRVKDVSWSDRYDIVESHLLEHHRPS